MTSITPRIITIALLVLAVAAPVASARPLRDAEGVQTSSLAGTTSDTFQDLRNPDNRTPPVTTQDLRNPDNRVPIYVPPVTEAPRVTTPAVATDDAPSPFVYIIPGVVLIAMLGAGIAFARTSRPARRTAA